MGALYSYLAEHPVTYVTRQRERAEALPEDTPGYFVFADPNKSTREILASEKFRSHQERNPSDILVFKSNKQEEELIRNMGWKILNPNAELAEKVEAKISQTRWLGDLVRYLPPHAIRSCKDLRYDGKPSIVQFNHGHSGLGTTLLDREAKAVELATKFPARLVRITKFIKGAVYTNNNVVVNDRVLVGNLSYQITGLIPLTSNSFATVGNDFGLGAQLGEKERNTICDITRAVGEKLTQSGWQGCFGTDFIIEDETKVVYLIEVNARQTASVVFESKLQKLSNPRGLTTFEAHLKALVNLPVEGELVKVSEGSRFLQRLTDRVLPLNVAKKLNEFGFETIVFNPETDGDDLLHICSAGNLMQAPGQPSELGRQVLETLIKHD